MRGYGKLMVLILALALMMPVVSGAQAAELDLVVTLDKETVAVDLGESITGSWQASGGTGEYSYELIWYVVENDAWMIPQENRRTTQTSETFVPTYGQSGELRVGVFDGKRYNEKTVAFNIKGAPVVPSLRLEAQLNTDQIYLETDQFFELSWTAQGGEPPYRFFTHWLIGGENLKDTEGTAVSPERFTPSRAGDGSVVVAVKDSKGRVANPDALPWRALPFADYESNLSVEISTPVTQMTFGNEPFIPYQWTISGGRAPFQVSVDLLIDSGSTGKTEEYTDRTHEDQFLMSEVAYTTQAQLRIDVTDALGNFTTASSHTIDILDPNPMSGEVSVDKPEAGPGDSVLLTAQVTGGQEPYTFVSANMRYASSLTGRIKYGQEAVPEGNQATLVIPQDVYDFPTDYWIIVKDAVGRELTAWGRGAIKVPSDKIFPGDADGSKSLGVGDLEQLVKYILDQTLPADQVNANADGLDGVDMDDVLWVINRIVTD